MLLSDGLDEDDLNMLGNLLSTIGSMIATFAGAQDALENEPQNTLKDEQGQNGRGVRSNGSCDCCDCSGNDCC